MEKIAIFDYSVQVISLSFCSQLKLQVMTNVCEILARESKPFKWFLLF